MNSENLHEQSKEELIRLIENLLKERNKDEIASLRIRERQEEIYQFYDRYRIISKMAKEGLWELYIPDKFSPHTPIWYSEEFIRILGYEMSNFPQKVQTFINLIEPIQRDIFLQERAKLFRGLLPEDVYEKEILLKTGTGEYKWFELKSKVIRSTKKAMILEVGVMRSVHSRKIALNTLQESEKTLRYVSYASKDGIYDVSLIDYEAKFSENYYIT